VLFDQFNPVENQKLEILDKTGTIINKDLLPRITQAQLLEGYRYMLYSRMADLQAFSYQRQGRLYTFPPNFGQEASAVGAGLAMAEDDWLIPAYRELGAWLRKGATVKDFFLYWGGTKTAPLFPGPQRFFHRPSPSLLSSFMRRVLVTQ
jgi:pyruvate dehydrogenase E1 component alpha subunit